MVYHQILVPSQRNEHLSAFKLHLSYVIKLTQVLSFCTARALPSMLYLLRRQYSTGLHAFTPQVNSWTSKTKHEPGWRHTLVHKKQYEKKRKSTDYKQSLRAKSYVNLSIVQV